MAVVRRLLPRRACCVPICIAITLGVSLELSAERPVPRTGPISIIHVGVSDAHPLDALVHRGFDIGAVHGDMATVYATSDEEQQLRTLGYPISSIEPEPGPIKDSANYLTFEALAADLKDLADAHPDLCRLYDLGGSVQGRSLWALLITNNPGAEEDEPEMKYIGGIHGNETAGPEMCRRFARFLLEGYGANDRITRLVNTTAVWVLPLMNPDGLAANQRFNANGFDLNRSFPAFPWDFFDTMFREDPPTLSRFPVEVAHVMQWTLAHTFVLSASFHTGSLVVNYPYDDDRKSSGDNAPSPDDALFQDIARRYSQANGPMWNSPEFADGITNGSAWYTIVGGMQDWNYRYAACNELTIELSNITSPAPATMDQLWEDNRESMLRFAEAAHMGVRGIVTDQETHAPLWAEVRVKGNAHSVYTDPKVGDYHRMLLPGVYTVKIAADNHVPKAFENVAVTDGATTRLDAELLNADVNGDGRCNAIDVQLVINSILGKPTTCQCDIDGDGVTSTDLQSVINAVLSQT